MHWIENLASRQQGKLSRDKRINGSRGTRQSPEPSSTTPRFVFFLNATEVLVPGRLNVQVLMQDKGHAGPLADCTVLLFNREAAPLPVEVTAIRLNGKDVLPRPASWELQRIGTISGRTGLLLSTIRGKERR